MENGRLPFAGRRGRRPLQRSFSAVDLQHLLAQFTLNAAKLLLGVGALDLTVGADLVQLIQRLDQLLVRLLQGLDIHDAALGLLGDINGALFQRFGVLLQKLVLMLE